MNKLDIQYQELLKTILEYGVDKKDRTGTGTKSIFGYTIRHNMKEGFPLLTTKKMAIKSLMTELRWFLKGDTNIRYLIENNCNIWNGDAYKNYKLMNVFATDVDYISMGEFIEKIKTDDKFAELYGELGPVYGKQWKKWDKYDHQLVDKEGFPNIKSSVDQIKNLIEQIKDNPDSRRLIVSAWNPGDIDKMVLPPCHYGFQVYTRELNLDERIDIYNEGVNPMSRSSDYFHEHMDAYGIPRREISLMWNQRSVDTFLGLPFNIASYAMLLTIIADEVNMVPGDLIGNLGDVHLYNNHLEQAKEQIKREPYKLPKLVITNCDIMNGEFEYKIINYESHPTIKAPLSN
ncbi:thymidylate synthase [archaeon]|nr:thymidylate synthase [archaeon]NDB80331.1 thymidylate synthase [archaeon]